MTTVAGTGVAGYSGDNGLATVARFNQTDGIAIGASGNMYVSDFYYNVIRMITKSTGIITMVAGTGRHTCFGYYNCYTGDGYPATNATLYGPAGIAVDTSGNIFIADLNNHVIRKVTYSTGIITTVAGLGPKYASGYSGDGGPAASARFNGPYSVAVDASGNIFIADTHNYVIRKVTYSTGIISTVAGTGISGYSGDDGLATAAQMTGAFDVAVDSSGNIYISDFGNYVIRKVTYSTGIITTVAGTGIDGYTGDGGPATEATSHRTRGLAVDTSGNIYYTDYGSYVIRMVTKSTGIITTIAGTGVHGSLATGGPTSSSLSSPLHLAVSNQTLYFTDADSHVVRSLVIPRVNTTKTSSAIPNYLSVGLYNPVWWISASLLLFMW